MPNYTPVVYGVVGKKHQSVVLSNWDDAIKLFEEQTDWKNPAAEGIRMCTCKNWWHQDLLRRLCKGGSITGIDFLTLFKCWCCLSGDELSAAQKGIQQLLALLNSEIPDLGELENESVEELRQNLAAFQQAKVEFKIGSFYSSDRGFEAIKEFCSFIKTLDSTISEAINSDACFVYVLPPA